MATGSWLAILAGFAVAAAAVAAGAIRRARLSPAERERRRRLTVSARGRVGSATITDYQDGVISYTYTAGGVEHSATQDISALLGLLPQDPVTGIAQPASLKYLLRNPANSIVLAKNWSGLRFRAPSDSSANHARKGAE